jgi:hypothetical protein
MGTNGTSTISLKFLELKSEFNSIMDDINWLAVDQNFGPFIKKLNQELLELQNTSETICEIYAWIQVISDRLPRLKVKQNSTELARSRFIWHRDLKDKLTGIRADLISRNNAHASEVVKDREHSMTLKQQVLLLKKLGILDMDDIKNLAVAKQAKLFSGLLGCSNNTLRVLLLNIDKTEQDSDFTIYKEVNIDKVNELLNSVGLQKFMTPE